MGEEDGEVWYAYYALHKLRILPSEFANLPNKEKALIMVMIEDYCKRQKAQMKK